MLHQEAQSPYVLKIQRSKLYNLTSLFYEGALCDHNRELYIVHSVAYPTEDLRLLASFQYYLRRSEQLHLFLKRKVSRLARSVFLSHLSVNME